MSKGQTMEQKVVSDLLWAEAYSDFVYEESYNSDEVYLVEFSEEGEPIARYRVRVNLEKIS